MLSKVRRFAAVAVAATAISAALPAGTAAARPDPCRVSSFNTTSEYAVVVEGHWVDTGGGDVRLTCHLVQSGVKVASATEDVPGPVAVIASDQRIDPSYFRVCYEVTIEPANPWGPLYFDTNC
ncbi:MAG TPA: hypothetical protein VG318_17690 [Actinomycetota bacterium]|nr:hypothetical protein [Actinomycetota bacterium]